MPRSDAIRAPLEAALDVVGGQRQRQPVGIPRDHPPGDVELLQLHPGVAAVLDLAGDVDRPELRPHLPLRQPVEIGVPAVSGRGGRRPPRRAAPSLDSRIAQGRSLCPSISGVEREQLSGVLQRAVLRLSGGGERHGHQKSVSGEKEEVSGEQGGHLRS